METQEDEDLRTVFARAMPYVAPHVREEMAAIIDDSIDELLEHPDTSFSE